MKVEVKETEPSKKIKYPCLMKSGDVKIIVFFFDEQKGTVVSSKDRLYKLGEYGEDWEMGFFTPFNGTLTLQND